jgi:hypothetical protein
MNRLLITPLAFAVCSYAQTAKVSNTTETSPAPSQPCVIVARHVHKFGENMSRLHAHRPFDYVEGSYPTGFKWRSELSDSDVRELQQDGGKIVVLRPDYQVADVEDARKQCQSPGAN